MHLAQCERDQEQRGSEHPTNAAELTNTSGKTLDGGPITVYDGGAYGGEALMETLKAKDKRLNQSVAITVVVLSNRYQCADPVFKGDFDTVRFACKLARLSQRHIVKGS